MADVPVTDPDRGWGSYFYPETVDPTTGAGVLVNRFGLRDPEELRRLEYKATAVRQMELEAHPDRVARTWDAAHVRGLHRYLFQDVYPWAGRLRAVNLSKNGRSFCDVESIGWVLQDLARQIRSQSWERMPRDRFPQAMAEAYTLLNFAHPFREGNGRTGKLFLQQLAERTPDLRLDPAKVAKAEWDRASLRSLPDDQGYRPQALARVMSIATVECPGHAARPQESPQEPGLRSARLSAVQERPERLIPAAPRPERDAPRPQPGGRTPGL